LRFWDASAITPLLVHERSTLAVHPLRAADALQLGAALAWKPSPTGADEVVCPTPACAVDGLIIVRIEPDELVTMAAIAERDNLSRESIRLLSRGDRGPGGFPAPVAYADHRHGSGTGRTSRTGWPSMTRPRSTRAAACSDGEGGARSGRRPLILLIVLVRDRLPDHARANRITL